MSGVPHYLPTNYYNANNYNVYTTTYGNTHLFYVGQLTVA